MQLNIVFQDWLRSRKISEQTQKEFNVGYGRHEGFGECIVIPVYDVNGEFLFNKYRRNPLEDQQPKYIYDKGGKVSLYGINRAKDATDILITEGEMDCLVAWSHNIPAVTSTAGALSFQEEWADFFKDKNVTVCFDNDMPGGEGMVKVLNYLPNAKILFLPDRPGIKDISDYAKGDGDLHTLLKTAQEFKSMEDVREDMAKRRSLYKSTYFHEAYIKDKEVKTTKFIPDKKIKDKLQRAKQYPLTELISFNAQGKACCPLHNEKTPSLHYYEKSNTAYCFGCGKTVDSIEAYKLKNNCSFTEAVDALSKMT